MYKQLKNLLINTFFNPTSRQKKLLFHFMKISRPLVIRNEFICGYLVFTYIDQLRLLYSFGSKFGKDKTDRNDTQ
jgi:hypothetical protein